MSIGSLELYDQAIVALVSNHLGDFTSISISAALLGPDYVPDFTVHSSWQNVSAYEVASADYSQAAVTGGLVNAVSGGASFSSDNISFGKSVTIENAKYLVLVAGTAGALNMSDTLIGVLDLHPVGDTISSLNAVFEIIPPAEGWFQITRS